MPQTITRGYKTLLDEANAKIRDPAGRPRPWPCMAARTWCSSTCATRASWSGRAAFPARVHCPRGMLEFWIDPESPYHKPVFAQDKTFVFFCAAGWRSALSAATAQDMGLQPVAHMEGGFTAWKNAGGPVETMEPTKA